MKELRIENQGHTVGCMLRNILIENPKVRFAACTVKHPQDKHMTLTVDAEDSVAAILEGIQDATALIESYLKSVRAFRAHEDAGM